MALETESAHVGEVALATAFDHGDDMVGIPQAFSAAEVPSGGCTAASASAEPAEVDVQCEAIDAAERADAAVTLEDPLP